jgi:hypothetical protein
MGDYFLLIYEKIHLTPKLRMVFGYEVTQRATEKKREPQRKTTLEDSVVLFLTLWLSV